jgi:hypothetical protein
MHDGQRRLYATPSRSEEGMRKTAMSAVRLVERLLLAQHCSRRRPLQSHKKVTVARTSEHGNGGWKESKSYREGTPLMAEVSGWRHVTAAVPIALQTPDRIVASRQRRRGGRTAPGGRRMQSGKTQYGANAAAKSPALLSLSTDSGTAGAQPPQRRDSSRLCELCACSCITCETMRREARSATEPNATRQLTMLSLRSAAAGKGCQPVDMSATPGSPNACDSAPISGGHDDVSSRSGWFCSATAEGHHVQRAQDTVDTDALIQQARAQERMHALATEH